MKRESRRNRIGLGLAGIGILVWLASFVIDYGVLQTALGSLSSGSIVTAACIGGGGAIGVVQLLRRGQFGSARRLYAIGSSVRPSLLGLMLVMKIDFGLAARRDVAMGRTCW